MKKHSIIYLALVISLFAGCTQPSTNAANTTITELQTSSETVDSSTLFSDRDYETEYKVSECIDISLNGSTATGKNISISDGTVTITKEGSYLISGNLTDGMIIVDTTKDSKVQLILNNVTIHSENSAPIYIKQADKVFITLDKGSQNTLSNGGNFISIDENNIDSVIFSKDDLTLNGSGSLVIQSPAGHGIVSKDDLRITGGNYNLTTAGHGLFGRDAISVADGVFTIQSGKDGIQAENDEDNTLGTIYIGNGNYQITSDGDGISSGNLLHIENGTFNLLCGGGSEFGEEHTDDMFGGMGGPGGMGGKPGGRTGAATTVTTTETSSAKGLKSVGDMTIINGSFTINSADDGLHSNNNLTVLNGNFEIATGDDGLHADKALHIGGGKIHISESYEGLEGLSITVAGGDITLKASDDGLNAAGGNDESGFGGMGGRPGFGGDQFGTASDSFILISGGKLNINADGDGIDSNGNLTFTGGYTIVEGPTNNGNGPLDYNGTGTLSGGTVIVSGSSGMAQSLTSTDTQGVFAINVGSRSAGTTVTIKNQDNTQIISFTPSKSFGCVVVSTPDILKGSSYTITIGENSDTFTAQ